MTYLQQEQKLDSEVYLRTLYLSRDFCTEQKWGTHHQYHTLYKPQAVGLNLYMITDNTLDRALYQAPGGIAACTAEWLMNVYRWC